MLKALAYIGISSPATAKWAIDGPEIYGFERIPDGPDGAVRLRNDDRAWRIAIHPGAQDELSYIGWDIGSPADLQAAIERLSAYGVIAKLGDAGLAEARGVAELAWFTDPIGFRHELISGQVAAPSTFRPGRGNPRFVTGGNGLGHIVLFAPDISYDRFVTEVLGFKLTDRVIGDAPVRFYHINARHHSLGFVVVPGMVGFHHLMVEVDDLNDVGLAYDLALERGVEMYWSLGTHGNDRMTSFYARSPSGFELEYGYGGRAVDDATWVVESYTSNSIWGHHEPKTGRIPSGIIKPFVPKEH